MMLPPTLGGFARPCLFAGLLALSLSGAQDVTGYQLRRGPSFAWSERSQPVPFHVANRPDNLLTVNELVAEARASIQTWTDEPTVGLTAAYAGLTNLRPFDFFDNTNTVGFTSREHFAELGVSRTTLAVTAWLVQESTGAIVESDIVVNPAYNWSADPGDTLWDIRSNLVHEFGHFMGLGHSGVGREDDRILVGSAIMWPYTFGRGATTGRTLTYDDVHGASVLYPVAGAPAGGIRGTVVDANRMRVAHAHVSVYEPTRDLLTGVWADRNGDFEVARLPPGNYLVRLNPIPDEHPALAYGFRVDDVDRDFRVTIAPRFVAVHPNRLTEVVVEVKR